MGKKKQTRDNREGGRGDLAPKSGPKVHGREGPLREIVVVVVVAAVEVRVYARRDARA